MTLDATGNAPNRFIRCAGLTPGAMYREEDSGWVYSANALMSQGLPMPKITVPGLSHQVIPGEYEAFQIHLCKV